METSTDAALPGGASIDAPPADIVQVPAPKGGDISTRDAARSLASFRLKARESEAAPAAAAPPSAPSAEASAPAEAEPAPGGEAQAAAAQTNESAATEAPVEPPKSWEADARERFKSLPRETQDFLIAREQEREAEISRTQSETAHERAALDTERAKAEQARLSYENALPSLVATLQQQHASDFSDVKSVIDVERLAHEDWPRYVAWDAQQKRIGQMQQQLQEAGARQQHEHAHRFQDLVQREQALFIEKNPELADPGKRAQLTVAAGGMLRELGFSDADLGDFFHGRRQLNLHDHRVQMLIRDGVRLREAQKAAKLASARPTPPVQRPGAAQPRGAAHEAAVQGLGRRLDQTGNLKDAARLLAERRKAAR